MLILWLTFEFYGKRHLPLYASVNKIVLAFENMIF